MHPVQTATNLLHYYKRLHLVDMSRYGLTADKHAESVIQNMSLSRHFEQQQTIQMQLLNTDNGGSHTTN